jgi:hypothetical protein
MFRLIALSALILLHAVAASARAADTSRAPTRRAVDSYVPQIRTDIAPPADAAAAAAELAARRAPLGGIGPNIEADVPASLLSPPPPVRRFIKDADYANGGGVPPSQSNPAIVNAQPQAAPAPTPAPAAA